MTIEINLLPESFYKAKRKKKLIILLVGVCIVFLAIVLGVYFKKVIELAKINKEIHQVEEEQKKYEQILKEIEQINKDRKLVAEKEKVISSLQNQQIKWPRFLYNFNQAVPNLMWVKSLTNTSQGNLRRFTLKGNAVNKNTVTKFLANLELRVQGIQNIELKNIFDTGGAEIGRVSFEIVFTVKL